MAVVAGLIAAVKLARVESKEIVNRDSVKIAKMFVEASRMN